MVTPCRALRGEPVDLSAKTRRSRAMANGGECLQPRRDEFRERQRLGRRDCTDLIRASLGFVPICDFNLGFTCSAIIPNPVVTDAAFVKHCLAFRERCPAGYRIVARPRKYG
jgi:hypothetical protein